MTKAQQTARGSTNHAGGPPLKYTPGELAAKVEEYFAQEGKKSVAGLCLHLDCGRDLLLDYARRDEFSDIIARAKLRIMQYYEELGQEVRSGMFPDRMLTRMKWPCVEQQRTAHEVATLSDLAAKLGGAEPAESLPAAPPRVAIESVTRDRETGDKAL